jgi:3-oxoacyl-[acyl-carrier protein] reductase
MINLNGRTVLIAGGSRGIGAACAVLFARAGADVGILFRTDRAAAGRIADAVKKSGKKAVIVNADVTRMKECRAAVRNASKMLGRIDILVNSAGIWEYAPIRKMTDAAWKNTIDVNLNGSVNMIRAVLPLMAAARRGIIVNVASTAGQRGEADHSHYAAAKGGIIAFTKSIGVELIPLGIRVNCVSPGWVDTDMVAGVLKKQRQRKTILASTPRGKIATSNDIAGPVLFLASDLAEHIVGSTVNVNGGSVLI